MKVLIWLFVTAYFIIIINGHSGFLDVIRGKLVGSLNSKLQNIIRRYPNHVVEVEIEMQDKENLKTTTTEAISIPTIPRRRRPHRYYHQYTTIPTTTPPPKLDYSTSDIEFEDILNLQRTLNSSEHEDYEKFWTEGQLTILPIIKNEQVKQVSPNFAAEKGAKRSKKLNKKHKRLQKLLQLKFNKKKKSTNSETINIRESSSGVDDIKLSGDYKNKALLENKKSLSSKDSDQDLNLIVSDTDDSHTEKSSKQSSDLMNSFSDELDSYLRNKIYKLNVINNNGKNPNDTTNNNSNNNGNNSNVPIVNNSNETNNALPSTESTTVSSTTEPSTTESTTLSSTTEPPTTESTTQSSTTELPTTKATKEPEKNQPPTPPTKEVTKAPGKNEPDRGLCDDDDILREATRPAYLSDLKKMLECTTEKSAENSQRERGPKNFDWLREIMKNGGTAEKVPAEGVDWWEINVPREIIKTIY